MIFRSAELGRKVTKEAFAALEPDLRIEMIELQRRLSEAGVPVILVFAGVEGGGKSESVNLLHDWMDPRGLETNAYIEPSEEERERPPFWRYWRDLPPRGKIGLFLNEWHWQPVVGRVHHTLDKADMDERLAAIKRFETLLADDGYLILKFWMHLSKDQQKQRLKTMEADPLQAWRLSPHCWKHWEQYDALVNAAEHMIHVTDDVKAPWILVDGNDHRYRAVTVLAALRDAAHRHLDGLAISCTPAQSVEPTPLLPLVSQPTLLSALDMTKALTRQEYDSRFAHVQAQVSRLFRAAKEKGVSTVMVFEGWDAAGKGGAIRSLTSALDARDYRAIPIAIPNDEEKSYPYLWRFWRRLGRSGRCTIYDRSWYGRVLVERVDNLIPFEAWGRAYGEITAFEEELVSFGMLLCKFWLHITPEEQLKRFQERAASPLTAWKLTDDDWRNRSKRDAYEGAVNEMIEKTSLHHAPWRLIEANDKHYARVTVMESIAEALEKRLDRGK